MRRGWRSKLNSLGMAPPRPRGCARRGPGLGHGPRGSPAPAGMRHDSHVSGSRPSRLPRARGDAPAASPSPRPPVDGSPAPAGMRREPDGPGPILHGAPPRPRGCALRPWHASLPRVAPPRPRGCARAPAPRSGFGAPPRPRGCAPWSSARLPSPGSPAPAGMRPVCVIAPSDTWRLPRARGDAPGPVTNEIMPGLPRARGDAPRLVPRPPTPRAGSPAPAGMRPYSTESTAADSVAPPRPRGRARHWAPGFQPSRLPRARGDAPYGGEAWTPPDGSPAPAGTRPPVRAGPRHLGSPAPAGMRRSVADPFPMTSRLPRARGDAPMDDTDGHDVERGSPAPAGMRPSPNRSSRRSVKAPPRPRGCAAHDLADSRRDAAPPRPRGCAIARLDSASALGSPPRPRGCARGDRGRRSTATGVPRARGDAPFQTLVAVVHLPAPPRPRVCAHRHAGASAWSLRIPRARGTCRSSRSPLHLPAAPPRPRGCARTRPPATGCAQAPPRPRGCARSPGTSRLAGGSPAPAGMRPPSSTLRPLGSPAPAGMRPAAGSLRSTCDRAPPRPRRCAAARLDPSRIHDGSPAPRGCAGRPPCGPAAPAPPRPRGCALRCHRRDAMMPAPPRPRGCARGRRGPRHVLAPPRPRGCARSRGPLARSRRLPRARGDAPSVRLTRSRGQRLPRARGDAPGR